MLAIACGYEDADDLDHLDHLRIDPGFRLACGRLPDTGRDLCSQPTIIALGERPDPARGYPPESLTANARWSMPGATAIPDRQMR